MKLKNLLILLISITTLCFVGCDDDSNPNGITTKERTDDDIDFSLLTDTYDAIASEENASQWGIHNVHDPIIRKFGDSYYSYSTDVGYGIDVRMGLQIRKSKNLVEWDFVGWVFDELPPKGAAYIENIGAKPNKTLWAPSVYEYNGEYRLYYSLASNIGLKSCIGLAVSSNPENGWQEVDVVVGTNNSGTATNGIDPSVIITPDDEHWMVYGSSWDGIYIMQLDPETGLAMKDGDKGKRIAHRGFTGGQMNGNIEGPEIIYNYEHGYYYLFIAYDWLSTKYNIRVGRSETIDGPYLDMFGKDMYGNEDNYPMIVAPYRFNEHAGWQGVSHCTVFEDDGQFYVAHQGRPNNSMYSMDMHVRQLFWTEDGWPVASPERYAAHDLSEIDESGIVGNWELIDFDYTVVPGFADEQINPGLQSSVALTLNEDGTINSSSSDVWTYDYPWLSLTMDGETTDVHVSVGRDWERSIDSTIVFTGTHADGMPLWGKKNME